MAQSLRHYTRHIGIEPLLMLERVAKAFNYLFAAKIVRERICVDLGFAEAICADLKAHHHVSSQVGHMWAEWNAYTKSKLRLKNGFTYRFVRFICFTGKRCLFGDHHNMDSRVTYN